MASKTIFGFGYPSIHRKEQWDRDASGAPGFLTFGWGSCSGCDALQACSTYRDLAELMASLASGVIWFADDAELREWFVAHDWEGDWHWGSGALQGFLAEAGAKYGFEVTGG
jgi:hypothetical protein